MSMRRRPKPCRSGKLGCAPMLTPWRLAVATVWRITSGSPAWKPQATLAESTSCSMSASRPIVQAPKDSPRSALRLMRRGLMGQSQGKVSGVGQASIMPLIRLPVRSAASSASPSARSGPMRAHPVVQRRGQRAARGQRLVARHGTKAQHAARPRMRQARQVGADHRGDLGVAADGLRVHAQHDRLAVAGHLHRARRHAFGHDVGAVAGAVPQRRALQAQPHAVGLARDAVVAADEQRPGRGVEEARPAVRAARAAARRHARRARGAWRCSPWPGAAGAAGRRHAARGRRCRPGRRGHRWSGCPAPAARRRRRPAPGSRCRCGRARRASISPGCSVRLRQDASGCALPSSRVSRGAKSPASARRTGAADGAQRRPEQGHLQRRQLGGLRQQRVGAGQQHRVGRAGQRHADGAVAAAAQVLDRHAGAGVDELEAAAHGERLRVEPGSRAAACRRPRRAPARRSGRGRWPASAPRRRGAARPGRRPCRRRTAPAACAPAGASRRGCARGRPRTCGRPPPASARAPPCAASRGAAAPARRAAAHVGEAGLEAEHVDAKGACRSSGHHLLRRQAARRGQFGQVGREFGIEAHRQPPAPARPRARCGAARQRQQVRRPRRSAASASPSAAKCSVRLV